MQNETQTSAATTKHPSGLTWERWHQPFKMPEERKMIQQWLQKKQGEVFDETIPF